MNARQQPVARLARLRLVHSGCPRRGSVLQRRQFGPAARAAVGSRDFAPEGARQAGLADAARAHHADQRMRLQFGAAARAGMSLPVPHRQIR